MQHHGELGDVLNGLLARARRGRRYARRDSTLWIGLFALFNGGVSTALMALGALGTAGFMVWLRVPHPPAGATTLIVSLGIVPRPTQLLALFVAIVLLVIQGLVINRIAGVPYPRWAPRAASSADTVDNPG